MAPASIGTPTQTSTRREATRRIRPLRISRARLQTPVLHYTHPATGRRVMTVGMYHIGLPAYYDSATALVDTFAAGGGVVQREGTNLYAPTDTHITAEEQAALDELRASDDALACEAALLGWSTQADCMPVRRTWQRFDVTALEIVRFVGAQLYRQQMQAERAVAAAVLDMAASVPRTFRVELTLHLWHYSLQEPRRTPLFDKRHEQALAGVDSTDRDTALIWGSAHLPAFHTALRERGFVVDRWQWLTVGTLHALPYALAFTALNLPRATAYQRGWLGGKRA